MGQKFWLHLQFKCNRIFLLPKFWSHVRNNLCGQKIDDLLPRFRSQNGYLHALKKTWKYNGILCNYL